MCFCINAIGSRSHVGKRSKLADEGNGERSASFSISGSSLSMHCLLPRSSGPLNGRKLDFDFFFD